MQVNVLLVKMSSMGDVIHALYAVEDAARQIPDIRFDWVVEEGFADLPALHRSVREVLPVAIRRWRCGPLAAWRSGEPVTFLNKLRSRSYDLVLDAQGLAKSALVAAAANGPTAGFDRHSARESIAALACQHRIQVPRGHAIGRLRSLFAAALDYDVPGAAPEAVLSVQSDADRAPYVVFVHGTTWTSKEYPLEHWQVLAGLAAQAGFRVVLPAGNEAERRRGAEIAQGVDADIAYGLSLADLAGCIGGAAGVVSVDSGLGHLADALGRPLVALFGSTSPVLTGPRGRRSEVIVSTSLPCVPCFGRKCRLAAGEYAKLHPPCFDGVSPPVVWAALSDRMDASALPS